MEQLSEQATTIFSRIIDAMEGELIKTFHSPNGEHIRILDYDFSVSTDQGEGFLYSFAYLKGEPLTLGLSMREQIVFIVVNNQHTSDNIQNLIITPQHYECFVTNKFEESTTIKNGAVYRQQPDILQAHILLAEKWLTQINEQGFIQ